MKNYLFLLFAIITEVCATSALKQSDGFTKLYPSLITVVGYCCSFYLLSLTLRTIPVGIAYAIWSGLGTALITLVGWLVFGQKLSIPAMIGIGCILLGVVLINLSSQHP